MTVADLIAKLQHLPPYMLVYVPDNRDGWTEPSEAAIRPMFVHEDGSVSRTWDTFDYDIQAVVVG